MRQAVQRQVTPTNISRTFNLDLTEILSDAQSDYQLWQAEYFDQPGRFVREMFDWERVKDTPADYQIEICDALFETKRYTIRGPRGLGKTALASWLTHWFALTRDGRDWKEVTTAGSWTQLIRYLWPEIRKWSRYLRWDQIGRQPYDEGRELLRQNLQLSSGEALSVASEHPALIEGAHADHVLLMFDEAKSIRRDGFEAMEGVASGAGSDTGKEFLALCLSTPGEPSGVFYDMHAKKPEYHEWSARHISKDETVKAGRISREWVAAKEKAWPVTSPLYQNQVLGEFAEYGEDVLVPLAWIEAAMERHRQPTAVPGDEDVDVAYGVDPAERGSDQTAIVKMVGNRVEWIRYQQYDDPMRTAGRVAAELGEDTTTPVGVDSIGIGAGVLARLRELGYNTVDVRVSESTKRKDATGEMTFKNLRALVLWSVRERLNPNAEDDYGFEPISIPQDDKLTSDLTATKFEPNSAGQIVMRSKKDIRKETGRSPDALDGLAIALYAQQYRERVWVGSMAV